MIKKVYNAVCMIKPLHYDNYFNLIKQKKERRGRSFPYLNFYAIWHPKLWY